MNRVNTALHKLTALHQQAKREKYKSVPIHAMPASRFNVESTNGLTKGILAWLELKGHYCTRLQSQGQWNPKLGIFTTSHVKRGIGDVMAIINARHVMIEVKYGKDKLSEYQIRTKEQVERSGGFYFVAKDFDQFMQWYEDFTKSNN